MELTRRRLLQLASATVAAGVSGVSRAGGAPKATSMVLLFMRGGMSQIDTFDPKPGRPTGGQFASIETRVSGSRFSEHLPMLATRARKLTVLRSLVGTESDHIRAEHLIHTGFIPQSGVGFPAFGSYVEKFSTPSELPGYVILGPGERYGPEVLGPAYAPFSIGEPSHATQTLQPPPGILPARRQRRHGLMEDIDDAFAARYGTPAIDHLRTVRNKAIALSESSKISAFDISRETITDRQRYGEHYFGRSCLLARRLIDADVPFVEVVLSGWDTHVDNFRRVADLSARLDTGMSALLDDLAASGRLATTLVICLGEFGRTPQVNDRAGRDHYAPCSTAVLAGGGIAEGRVVGATDPDGMQVVDRPVSVADLFASLAHALGLPANQELISSGGRPITVIDPAGEPVRELFR